MKSFDTLLKDLEVVSPDKAAALLKRVEAILGYEPRVGVFGKTGAGKSSLCNALLGRKFQQSAMYTASAYRFWFRRGVGAAPPAVTPPAPR
ncbi:MAG: hypothetical protein HC780_10435, partial [Leptolyngbyaceae cyanobacterium CSU_1_3]|nr:hypothetical protein [Leptolyngbyaceae cyanobacterium CSU_1_3]